MANPIPPANFTRCSKCAYIRSLPVPTVTPGMLNGIQGVAIVPFSIVATPHILSYSCLNLPSGLSCDPTTGIISGTVGASGTYNATMQATNAKGTGGAPLTIVIVFLAKNVSFNVNLSNNNSGSSVQVSADNGTFVDYSTTGSHSVAFAKKVQFRYTIGVGPCNFGSNPNPGLLDTMFFDTAVVCATTLQVQGAISSGHMDTTVYFSSGSTPDYNITAQTGMINTSSSQSLNPNGIHNGRLQFNNTAGLNFTVSTALVMNFTVQYP